MKQFRCADIVPGCAATVRARSVDEVVAIATDHLHSIHEFELSDSLSGRVRQGVTNVPLWRSLFERS